MFKVDLHVHTKDVSTCGRVSAERLVLEYKKAGYNGIVICDHFNKETFDKLEGIRWKTKVNSFLTGYRNAKIAGDKIGLKVYLGMELRMYGDKNDFLIYGLDENFILQNEKLFLKSLDYIKKVVDENNLLIIQAHPFRPMCDVADESFVHGREVFNGHFNHTSNNDLAQELLDKTGGIATSGSDAHYLCDIGNGGVLFEEEPENIADALRDGKYTLIKTPNQWVNILFVNEAEENKIKIAKAFYEIDAVAFCSENGIVMKDIKGEEIKSENNIFVVNRCQVVSGIKNLKFADVTEPIVLFDNEINDNIKKMLPEMGGSLGVTLKGDDSAPYREGFTNYIGFDMVGDSKMFVADIMGPSVKLEKIEI